jgi:hypothetical protein
MAWASGEKEQAISRFSIDTDDRLGFSVVPAPHWPAGFMIKIVTKIMRYLCPTYFSGP